MGIKAWYGPGGALVCDSPHAAARELDEGCAAFYGGSYMIAESMSAEGARLIARGLGMEFDDAEHDVEGMRKVRIAVLVDGERRYCARGGFVHGRMRSDDDHAYVLSDQMDTSSVTRLSYVEAWVPMPKVEPVVTVAGVVVEDGE